MIHFDFDTNTQILGTEFRKLNVYAMNYNIFKMTNGLGGLAYTA
jgi:hypothetical protein